MPSVDWQTVSVSVVLGLWVTLMATGRLVPGSFYRREVKRGDTLAAALERLSKAVEKMTRAR